MQRFKTVLGNITEKEIGAVLPHEHIYCYNEYLYQMAGNKYLNKEKVFDYAVEFLKILKEKYGLRTFIDCTPVNIGRDIAMLKRISEATGINIICSTGFYFVEEVLFNNVPSEVLAEYIVSDAINVNAGIIKCAVENESISPLKNKAASPPPPLKVAVKFKFIQGGKKKQNVLFTPMCISAKPKSLHGH